MGNAITAAQIQTSLENLRGKNLSWEWAKTFWLIPIIGWILGTFFVAPYIYYQRSNAIENLKQQVSEAPVDATTEKVLKTSINVLYGMGTSQEKLIPVMIQPIFGNETWTEAFKKNIFPIYLNLARANMNIEEKHLETLPEQILSMVPQRHKVQNRIITPLKTRFNEIEQLLRINGHTLDRIISKHCKFEGLENVSTLIATHAAFINAYWDNHKFKEDEAKTIKLFQCATLVRNGDDFENALKKVKAFMVANEFQFDQKLKAWLQSADAYRKNNQLPKPMTNEEFLHSLQ